MACYPRVRGKTLSYLALGLATGIFLEDAWAFMDEDLCARHVIVFLRASSSFRERGMCASVEANVVTRFAGFKGA